MNANWIFTLLFLGHSLGLIFLGQQVGKKIDPAMIPREASAVSEFAPAGWMIEEEIEGDLNKDSVPDTLLKLVEKPTPDFDPDNPPERQRALLVLFRLPDGKWKLAAFAGKLLQCTRCGGAFYGVAESPADVKIENGVIIVSQDHGSREVVEETYRFRFDPQSSKFPLIGMDTSTTDRASGESVSESTNFLTGIRITTRERFDQRLDRQVKVAATRKRIALKKRFIEEVEALNR